jgi:hypothetical protein
LLKHGADTEARDKAGKSALDYAQDKGKTQVVALINQHRQSRANWIVLAPLLKCMQIHSTASSSSSSSSCSSSSSLSSLSPSVFSHSIDSLLPIIRRYAGYGDVPSEFESGSAACVSFLSCTYARTVIESESDVK